ncbi:MAG TPA: Calx-beta domain-containing protein [Pyrinomonadaceae bacterium]|jgi:hemoglobin-like flavoprotein
MTIDQINLIRKTFAQLELKAELVAEIFYTRLFELRPALRLLFPENLDAQKQKLMKTLSLAVEHLDNPEKLVPVLENLGRSHALYGVRDEYYDTVGAALIQTLSETLGEQTFSVAALQAWAQMYAEISATMQRAARELAVSEPNSFQQEKKVMQANQKIQKTVFAGAFNFLLFSIALVFVLTFAAATAQAATFIVTNTNDSGAGSLREAIGSASLSSNSSHSIVFNIPGTGVKTINLLSPLPDITVESLNIVGSTQNGYVNAPLIELNGANAGSSANGLNIKKGYVTVVGLVINRFALNGINADSGVALNKIALNVYGCYIGTGANGSSDLGNGKNGISLNANVANLTNTSYISNIGGTGATSRNIISGNGQHGVQIFGAGGDPIVKIYNNYIGTTVSGLADIGNTMDGIYLDGLQTSLKVEIGGSQTNQRNVISGNNSNGIEIVNSQNADFANVTVINNYIGLGANGSTALGNTNDGIRSGKSDVIIGGSNSGEGNVISANGRNGVFSFDKPTYTYMVVTGNLIGTDAAGTLDRGNGEQGVYLQAPGKVGGENAGEGNVIAGNGGNGIFVENTSGSSITSDSYILGNRIGVTQANAVLKNDGNGVRLHNTALVKIGYLTAGGGNVIGGNALNGILIGGSSISSVINNFIGSTPTGANVGNGADGIRVTSNSAKTNYIGGFCNNCGNTIAFNTRRGINIYGNPNENTPVLIQVVNNSIYSNGDLGIDLNADGVSLNDPNDTDGGANQGQNFPVITSAYPTQINGTFNSAANTTYVLQFFRTDSCDAATGHGEGRYLLGSKTDKTDGNGNLNFSYTGLSLTPGQIITATATYVSPNFSEGETSEFSQCFTVMAPPDNISFNQVNYAVNEGTATVTLTVNRIGNTTGAISVNYATSNGTAVAGQDYTAKSGTLAFADNNISQIIVVPITDDNDIETAETFNITLSNPQGGAGLVSPFTATITINDNDSVAAISGTVNYATTPINQTPKKVPGAVVSAAGASTASATTDSSANYLIENLTVGGQYTVTLSKTGSVNGISPFDATMILRHVAANGQGPNALNANQLIAADTNGNGNISPFDATLILRYIAGGGPNANTGQVGNWKFSPSPRNYPVLNGTLSGENYEAALVGEVSGNWTPAINLAPESEENQDEPRAMETETENETNISPVIESSDLIASSMTGESSSANDLATAEIEISLPNDVTAAKGSTLTVPVMVTNRAERAVSAYSFEVAFNPNVLQPDALMPIDAKETLSEGYAITHNIAAKSGRIGIAAAAAGDANKVVTDGKGALIYLRFKVLRAATNLKNNAIGLTFTRKPIIEDDSGSAVAVGNLNGSVNIVESGDQTSPQLFGTITGKVTTSAAKGIRNVLVTLTAPNGETRTIQTGEGGYYRFTEVPAEQTYVLTVESKRYTFAPQPVFAKKEITDLNLTSQE